MNENEIGASPKVDLSKLKLLKSPRVAVIHSLKVQTTNLKDSVAPDSARHKYQTANLDKESSKFNEKSKPNNIASPLLPNEKQ